MPRVRRVVPAVLMALVVSLLSPMPSAHASSPGWITVCPWSHTLPDDPIVSPGQPGAAHSHEFNANTTTDAYSTDESMLAGGTTCGTVADTAGYWIPSVYENGVRVPLMGKPPTGSGGTGSSGSVRQLFYYREQNISSSYKAAHPVEAFPAGFRMIAGNAHAMSEAESPKLGKELYWGCSDNSTGKLKAPLNCRTGVISLHVGFPNCWDGVFTGGNDSAHVTYPSSGACPSSHPRVFPRVIFRYEFPVGTTTDGLTLASGPYYTIHGDFWNTWRSEALESLVQRCLVGQVDCGKNPTP